MLCQSSPQAKKNSENKSKPSFGSQINSSLNNRGICELKARADGKPNSSAGDGTLHHALHVLRMKLRSATGLEMAGRRLQRESQQVQQPHRLGQLQELPVELSPGVVSGQNLAPLFQISEQRLLHLGVDYRQEFLEAEAPEAAGWEYPQELHRIHGFHVAVLRETLAPVLVRVEEGGEAAVHVECLVVEPLEHLAVHVRLQCVLCVVGPDNRVCGAATERGGFDGSHGGCYVPVCRPHQRQE